MTFNLNLFYSYNINIINMSIKINIDSWYKIKIYAWGGKISGDYNTGGEFPWGIVTNEFFLNF